MYKACIFDLDGTLTDTLDSLTYSVNATLKELSLSPITGEQCKSFVGSGARVLVAKSIRAAGGDEKLLLDKAMEIYKRIFQKYCTYHVTPYDGIRTLLSTLKQKNLKLAVLSNKPHIQTVDVVTSFFENDTFACVQGQMEGVPRKPDPQGALMIAEILGTDKRECLYIGDSDVDMQTGRAAGMDTVGVTWGFRTREVLKENGATYLIDKPEELIGIVEEKE